jgi:thioesterase domain-containing protein
MLQALVPPPARRSAASAGEDVAGSFAKTYAGLPEDDRSAAVLDLVRTLAAAVLGHPGAAAVPVDGGFPELGFDSLTAMDLRNRLQAATDVILQVGVVFDHPNPLELAAHLDAELARGSRVTDAEPTLSVQAPETISGLFTQALKNKQQADAIDFLRAAAKLRPKFRETGELTRPIRPLRLARRDPDAAPGPHLICVPALVAMAGVQQYSLFAANCRGHHDVSAVPIPGFTDGEALPADRQALVAAEADAIAAYTGGEPAVILGVSTGGLLVHAIATELTRRGTPPAGVALLDPYAVDSEFVASAGGGLMQGLYKRNQQYTEVTSAGLSAMAWCFDLMEGWELGPLPCPTLLVRASEPIVAEQASVDWRSSWPHADTVTDVPGNHFTIVEEHIADAVAAVRAWLPALG